jgi:putative peptidoglycan lipid II flippase
MNKLLQQTKKLFLGTQGGLFSSAMIISFMIIVSRIFGFVRYRILAGYFTKDQLDIFFASFRIPDLIFELLITGAITSTLIPIYIQYSKDEKERAKVISSILNAVLIILAVLVVVLVPCMPLIVPLIAPGFHGEKMQEIVTYSQILLVSQLPFLVIGNFLTGIAQAQKRFFITAIPPIIYNISVIIATYFFAPTLGLNAPIWGVVGGAILFTVIQIPIAHVIRDHYYVGIARHTGVSDFFRMIGPRLLTIVAAQIDATIDLTLTTLLGSGAYTIFYFAQHLQLLPVSVIGMSFGQASLPYLSELVESKKPDALAKIITESLMNVIFLTTPLAAYFIFARTPLVRMFFGGEKFDWDATVQTAFLLSYFAISIPIHAIYYVLTRCFYALLDTKTPFYASIIGIVINTALSVLFVVIAKMPVWSLGISFSLSISLQVLILFIFLNKKVAFQVGTMALSVGKIMFASVVAAPLPYIMIKLMDNLLLDTTRTINIMLLLGVSFVTYLLLYLFASWLLDVHELYVVTQLTIKAKEFQKKITEIYSSYD